MNIKEYQKVKSSLTKKFPEKSKQEILRTIFHLLTSEKKEMLKQLEIQDQVILTCAKAITHS